VLDCLKDKDMQVVAAAIFAAWRIGGVIDKDKVIKALTELQSRTDLPEDSAEAVKKTAEQVIKAIKEGRKPN